MKKINLDSFNETEILARLLTLVRNFQRDNIITLSKPEILEYTEKVLNENFIYAESVKDIITKNLLLFLMGNENNVFAKFAKL